jgi:SAM-dependent methyltransferase
VTSEPSEDQLDRIKSQIRADADVARQRAPLPPRAPPAATRDAAPAASGTSIADLGRFGGTAFVDRAYRAILKRPPDPAGLERQMALLGSGASKIEVIGDLRYSAEGRACATPIAGLLPRYLLAKLGRTPLLGAVVQWLIALASLPHMLRHQRATEASLAVRFDETAAALHASEQRDAELRSEFTSHLSNAVTQLSDRLAQAETHAETLRRHVEALDANVVSLRHLSLTMNHWALQVRQSIDAIETAETERQTREDEASAAIIARARSHDAQRAPRLQAWAEKVAKKMPAAAEVLDVCGGSDWLAALGARGLKVSSIETNSALHREARARHLDVTLGSPRSLLARVADESIDALTMGLSERIVEEMTPAELAREAQRILKRGGVLLIDVGDIGGPVEAALSDAALGVGFADLETLDVFSGKALMFERS